MALRGMDDLELSREELAKLSPDELVDKTLQIHRAYRSATNMVRTLDRQKKMAEEHNIKISQLSDFARAINTTEIDSILRLVIRNAPPLFGAKFAAIYLLDGDEKTLRLERCSEEGLQDAFVPEVDDDHIVSSLFLSGSEPFLVRDREEIETSLGRQFRKSPVMDRLGNSFFVCPLQVGSGDAARRVGVLMVGNRGDGAEPFHHHDVTLLVSLGEMLSTSISTCQLIRQIKDLAETDGLTRLANHRTFQNEMDRAMRVAMRYGRPLSLAMLDIDHFKSFNDTYGHAMGDAVLEKVAEVLKESARNCDIAARYGGEEFAVIMPETPLDGAMVLAERVRQNVESLAMERDGTTVSVTASLGVAQMFDDESKADFIDGADGALYDAKEGGRNRVRVRKPS